jgi:mannan endo-1,4-beta-mannosidase
MYLTRRKLIKFLAHLSVGSLAYRLIPAIGASSEPLYGINAYYLMIESYRKAQENPNVDVRKTILKYLQDDLKLARLRDKSKVNAIRFWAFNNYPSRNQRIVNKKFDFDAPLWPTATQLDKQVLEILEILMQSLTGMGFYLVPVLSNYWMSYGGILRYLEWAGHITQEDWFDAYCNTNTKEEQYYLKYSIDFYTLADIENLFQIHVIPIINSLRNNSKVVIVDVMNEPRGKSHYSVRNQIVKDGLYSHQIVAQWLNRQAASLRKNLPLTVSLTSGEEGWLVSPVNLSLNYLKNESQYFEGIDLKTNLYVKNSAFTMGSIHMYPHELVELPKVNDCGNQFTDRRGWYYLLQPHQPQHPKSFIKMGEEWLNSRAAAIGAKPWYIGEMGWCRSQSPENRSPLPATALQEERINIYRQWTEQAFTLGARGVFLWGLDGLQHRDEFYGLNSTQVMAIYPK